MNPYPYSTGAFKHEQFAVVRDTTNNVQQNVLSIPIAEEKVAYAKITAMCFDLVDFNPGAVVTGELVFFRKAGGEVQRPATLKLTPVISTFTNPQPQLDFVPNGNNMDVAITGKNGQNLRWYLDILISTTA